MNLSRHKNVWYCRQVVVNQGEGCNAAHGSSKVHAVRKNAFYFYNEVLLNTAVLAAESKYLKESVNKQKTSLREIQLKFVGIDQQLREMCAEKEHFREKWIESTKSAQKIQQQLKNECATYRERKKNLIDQNNDLLNQGKKQTVDNIQERQKHIQELDELCKLLDQIWDEIYQSFKLFVMSKAKSIVIIENADGFWLWRIFWFFFIKINMNEW